MTANGPGIRHGSRWPWSAAQPAVLGVAMMLAAAPLSARAELGGQYSSVMSDGARMQAKVKSVSATNFTIHNLSLSNGGEVRQFSRPDGTVFAVAWNGPGRPDLQQLLGRRFEVVQAENAPPKGRFRRHVLAVQRPDFVVRTGGHPGAFFGVAYLPQALPAGTSSKDLH
jgi:hypothetical protein